MKKIAVNILLSLWCTIYVTAQDTVVDQSMINEQWLLQDFLDLGNNGTPRYSILQIDTSKQLELYNFKRHQGPSVTSVFYSFGTGNDQLLSIEHNQQFGSWISGAIKFDKVRSDGIYLRQATNLNNLQTNLSLTCKRYIADIGFRYRSYDVQENGGITFDSLFTDNVFQNRQVFNVNLSDAVRSGFGHGAQLIHGVNLLRDTIGSIWHLEHHLNYLGNRSEHQDSNPLSGYYSSILLDSVVTRDRWEETHFSNVIGIYYTNDSSESWRLMYEVDIYSFEGIDIDTGFTDQSIMTIGWFSREGLTLQGGLKYSLSGYRRGDIISESDLSYKISSKGTIGFFGKYELREPEYRLREYSSNHFTWQNNFEKQTDMQAGGYFSFAKINATIKGGLRIVSDYIYFDNTALPAQYDSNVQIGFVEISGLCGIGKFKLSSRNVIQWTNTDSLIRIPSFHTNTSVYFEDSLFKRTMLARIGFNLHYYTSFNVPDYMPALGEYYMQNGAEQAGGYPFIDFFIDAKVREANFYVRLSHINAGLFGYDYFLIPHYAARDFGFYFGIKWRFEG